MFEQRENYYLRKRCSINTQSAIVKRLYRESAEKMDEIDTSNYGVIIFPDKNYVRVYLVLRISKYRRNTGISRLEVQQW